MAEEEQRSDVTSVVGGGSCDSTDAETSHRLGGVLVKMVAISAVTDFHLPPGRAGSGHRFTNGKYTVGRCSTWSLADIKECNANPDAFNLRIWPHICIQAVSIVLSIKPWLKHASGLESKEKNPAWPTSGAPPHTHTHTRVHRGKIATDRKPPRGGRLDQTALEGGGWWPLAPLGWPSFNSQHCQTFQTMNPRKSVVGLLGLSFFLSRVFVCQPGDGRLLSSRSRKTLESSVPGCAALGCTLTFPTHLLLFRKIFPCRLLRLAHNKPLHFLFAAAHVPFQPPEILPEFHKDANVAKNKTTKKRQLCLQFYKRHIRVISASAPADSWGERQLCFLISVAARTKQ